LSEAREYVSRIEKKIVLVDGRQLASLMVDLRNRGDAREHIRGQSSRRRLLLGGVSVPMIIQKNGRPIVTLSDWQRLAPPKSPEGHWKDNRSAKETARAWLDGLPAPPPEFRDLLLSHPDLAGTTVERAEPEALLRFDDASGSRNADMALWAKDERGPVAITVEAKADEPFDAPVAETFSKALERLLERPASAGVARIVHLTESLFRAKEAGQSRIGDLGYQLPTATAGTLANASEIGAAKAVLVIHEFVTIETSAKKLAANHADLAAFVKRMSRGAIANVEAGRLYGPIVVPGSPLFGRPAAFYVGKAVRHMGPSLRA
jgi:hypothetical protein